MCFSDTCVYDPKGMSFLIDVMPTENLLSASEMIGAVRGADPETGYDFDDTKRHIDQLDLSESVRKQIFETNARSVYPRLDKILKERGL